MSKSQPKIIDYACMHKMTRSYIMLRISYYFKLTLYVASEGSNLTIIYSFAVLILFSVVFTLFSLLYFSSDCHLYQYYG